MFIDIDSIKINNVSMGKYIVEAKYGYHKLWGKDSGRNLNGDITGSLIGVFPKITLQFKPLTKTELEVVVPLLDSSSQTVRYYDPNKKAYVEMSTYTGDYEVIDKNIISGIFKNSGFSCALIARHRRA